MIAEAFYLVGDIEKYGSGFIRIRKEVDNYPTMNFNFREAPNGFEVVLFYNEQKITSAESDSINDSINDNTAESDRINDSINDNTTDSDRINDSINDNPTEYDRINDSINDNTAESDSINDKTALLDIINNNAGINVVQIVELLDKSVSTINRYIKELKTDGKIEFKGARKTGGYYTL